MAHGKGQQSYSQGVYNGHVNTVTGHQYTVTGQSSAWGGQSSSAWNGQQAVNSYNGQNNGGGYSYNGHSSSGSYSFNGHGHNYNYNGHRDSGAFSYNGHISQNGQSHYQGGGHGSGQSIGWGSAQRASALTPHAETKKVTLIRIIFNPIRNSIFVFLREGAKKILRVGGCANHTAFVRNMGTSHIF